MLLKLPLVCTAALTLLLRSAAAQSTFSLFNASDIYPPPTAPECAAALGSAIQCPPALLDAIPSSNLGISNLTASDLQSVCTQSCYASLVSVAADVDSACQGWPFILGETSYVASLPFRYFAYYWNLTCLFDTAASEYCLNEAQSSISTEDQSIVSLPLSQLCTFCNIQKLDVQMTSPFGWDASFVPDWQTIQGDCSISVSNAIPSGLLFNASLAANGTNTNVTATPTLTPASNSSCVFGTYAVKGGDTCTSIAAANSLSYDQLVSVNGLDMNCTKLPSAGSNICLSGKCTTYTVQSTDTCVSIAEAKGLAWSQLLAWNPQINTYCDNLSFQVGKPICISPPGGGYEASATVSYVTGSPTAIAIPTAPIAPGSDRSVCGLWYTAIPGDTCPQILSVFQITNDTFYEINPNLNSDCSNLIAGFSYCVAIYPNATSTSSPLFAAPTTPGIQFIQYMSGDFPAMTGYLTDIANVTETPSAPPSVITPPTTSSAPTSTQTIAVGSLNSSQCLTYYEIQPGDSCLAIQDIYGISFAQFIDWNPEVNGGCTNIEVGLSYCVFGLTDFTPTPISIPPTSAMSSSSSTTTSASPTPTNIASGTITSGCNQYYTIVSGDSCSTIESNFGITLDQFIAWNPEVNNQCTNIDLGLAYCVSGPSITTTPVTGPTGAPVAPGTITTGCAQYYTIQSGDFCSLIDGNFDITLAQFLAWNTGVDANCDNLLLGFQYCVSGPGVSTTTTTTTSAAPTASGTTPQCTAFYTVQSGDSCSAIETKFGITMAQFLSWNTGLNSGCTNLLLGFEYCVAGP